MNDPKNSEAQNEELNLEQLEDAAGGSGHTTAIIEPNYITDPIAKQGSMEKGLLDQRVTNSGSDPLCNRLDTGSGHDRRR